MGGASTGGEELGSNGGPSYGAREGRERVRTVAKLTRSTSGLAMGSEEARGGRNRCRGRGDRNGER